MHGSPLLLSLALPVQALTHYSTSLQDSVNFFSVIVALSYHHCEVVLSYIALSYIALVCCCLPDGLSGVAGATTSQSLAVLKKTGHISFVLNENINYFKLTAG